METTVRGRAWVYGDNVDTDVIIPARYLTKSTPAELAPYCMEDIDASFAKDVRKGDIVVAGANFGCGSSREHAPLALLGAGVSAVIASSFARIFFRNAINVGLPILEAPDVVASVKKGDDIEIDLEKGVITDITTGKTFQAQGFPKFLSELIDAGGLVEYGKLRLAAKG
ncbi:MAG: 3-isopropylmalate dehydratase small subunit [Planctomycetes bacterium]|nr:3-isopropylmalate dehydratase small subunit [Planctomycetota bacterium]